MGEIKVVTDASFEADVLRNSKPVIVEYWAEWCGPCRMVAPVLEQIAVEQAGKLKIVKLNVDENQHTPMHFNVSGIPTMILFKDGQMVERIVGFMPKPQLLNRLRPHLEAAEAAETAAPAESATTPA